MFSPTMYDVGDYIFSFGLFFTLFFLFAKFLPVINMAEVKGIIKGSSAPSDEYSSSSVARPAVVKQNSDH
jgi:molybdopterin-containing oxidoreductase family membrane subunit